MLKFLNKYKKQFSTLKDFWDFYDVRDGVIYMNNGSYRLVLEVYSSNFELLSEDEKMFYINGFERVLREIETESPIKILVQTRKINIDEYINYIDGRYSLQNFSNKEIFQKYAEFLRNELRQYEKNIITKRFYLIIESSNSIVFKDKDVKTNTNTQNVQRNSNDILNDLLQLSEKYQSALNGIGIKSNVLDTDSVIKIIMSSLNEDIFYNNRKTFLNIEEQRKESAKNELPFILLNRISPEIVDVNYEDLIIFDKKYYVRSEYIEQLGSKAYPDWFYRIINFPHASDLMFTYASQDTNKALEFIRAKKNKILANEYERQTTNRPSNLYDQIVLEDTENLERKYLKAEVKPIDVEINVSFFANSIESLNQIHYSWKNLLSEQMMSSQIYMYEQIEGFKKTFVAGQSSSNTKSIRDLNSKVASFTYPFVTPQINNRSGFLYGINKKSNSLIVLDRLKRPNYNRAIIGSSGSGKSYFVKLDLIRSFMVGYYSFVIDIENEFETVVKYLGGKYITPNQNSSYFFNPFYFDDINFLPSKIYFVTNLFLKLIGNTVIKESSKAIISEAINNVYTKFSNSPIQPILPDFILELKKSITNPDIQEVVKILETYTKKSNNKYYLFNNQQNFKFDNDAIIAFGMKYIDEKELATAIILEQYWAFASNPKNIQIFKNIIVDEAHQLFNSSLVVDKLITIVNRGRKHNTGITTIVQSINQYLENRIGTTDNLLDQSAIKLIMKHNIGESFDIVSKKLNLNIDEKNYIATLAKGEGLLMDNETKIPIQIRGSSEEHELCSTTPNRLKK